MGLGLTCSANLTALMHGYHTRLVRQGPAHSYRPSSTTSASLYEHPPGTGASCAPDQSLTAEAEVERSERLAPGDALA